jgi:hypothetical protein
VVLIVKGDYIGGISRNVDHGIVPARMDDSKIITLQGNWKRAEEFENLLSDWFVSQHLWNDDAVFLVFFAKEPTVVVLAMAEQDVQIMVAQNALRPASFDEALDEIDDRWTIWATVSEVADEDEYSAIGMLSVVAVAKLCKQRKE